MAYCNKFSMSNIVFEHSSSSFINNFSIYLSSSNLTFDWSFYYVYLPKESSIILSSSNVNSFKIEELELEFIFFPPENILRY